MGSEHKKKTGKKKNPLRRITRRIRKKLAALLRPAEPAVRKRKENKKQLKIKSKQKIKKKEKQARALQKIAQLEYRLLSLGFTERATADLEKLVSPEAKPYQRQPAARALARWHANQRSEAGARRSLEMLATAMQGETNLKHLQRAAIMEAECHDLLGNVEAGQNAISRALDAVGPDAALYLAAANFEPSAPARLPWINRALALYGIAAISLDPSAGPLPLDCLKPGNPPPRYAGRPMETTPKVTVIMPVYNAEAVICTALDSILVQTWPNLEVLVVDDCSSDGTAAIIEEYCSRDSRVRLIRAAANSGSYVARNLALREATGTFVTCHDADDWSHPQKIERQALHLLQNTAFVGNTSQQVRTTADLKFYRRGKYGKVIFKNASSFMFRREPVLEAVGYWDCVRFNADVEYIKRVRKVFNDESVVDLPTGPLSFTRQHSGSLTGNEIFGFDGYRKGARREYMESLAHHHETAHTLRYDFPQQSRPFAVPEPMLPRREATGSGPRHFDVILASDFRLPGGTTTSNAEEIKAQKQAGLRTGLIQLSRYGLDADLETNAKIRDLIDGDRVQMIVYGEAVSCDCLIVKHPPVLQERQRFIPDVTAARVNVIINQTPQRDYGTDPRTVYDIGRCQQHLREYFGQDGTWHPVGPLVRETLHQHHAAELASLNLAEEDWVEIINVDEWRRAERPAPGPGIRIGRHSRDNYFKWPADPVDLLSVYPDTDDYEIHVLGGAETPRKTLGRLPKNWHVMEFGEVRPQEFLAGLDVFVYYTHPDMVESFGRVIIEAMAAGVPVILPPTFKEVFGEAAVYAEPAAVKAAVSRLTGSDDYYRAQVAKAQHYVEQHFGYAKHIARVKG